MKFHVFYTGSEEDLRARLRTFATTTIRQIKQHEFVHEFVLFGGDEVRLHYTLHNDPKITLIAVVA